MEVSKNILLIFRPDVMYQPVIYRLAREFELVFNILEAKIFPRLEGRLILELNGTEEDVERGIAYLGREADEKLEVYAWAAGHSESTT